MIPPFQPAPEGPFAFHIWIRGETPAGTVADDKYDDVRDDADHDIGPEIIPTEVEQLVFTAGERGPRGEEQGRGDADPQALTVGASAEEREQEHTGQPGGD